MDQPPPDALRIATWNIRAALGTDLRRDAGRVLETIARLGADIVALQEADHRLGARPSSLPRGEIVARTGLEPLALGQTASSLGWHGNALLVRPGLAAATGLHRFDLPGIEPRGAVAADLDTALGPLRVVAVHLGLLRRSRRQQIDHLKARLGALPERPTVILGDFNEWSRKKGLGRLAAAYELITPGPTYPAGRPLASLDRLAHTPHLGISVLPLPAMPGPHPSDHRPVLAELRARTDPDRPRPR